MMREKFKLYPGAGEMAQWVRALTALVEDPSSFPRTLHEADHEIFRGSDALVSFHDRLHTYSI